MRVPASVLLSVSPPEPIVRTGVAVPANVSVPSSKVMLLAVTDPETVIVELPVALVPAENTAASPLFQTAVALVPAATGFQFATAVLHVPVAVVVLVAPVPVPLISHQGSAGDDDGVVSGGLCFRLWVLALVLVI